MDSLAPSVWLYFTSIVVMTSWFAANLAVAVLFVEFASKEPKPPVPDLDITDIAEADVAMSADSYLNHFRYWVRHHIVGASWFSSLTIVCIIINTTFLAIVYHGMTDAYQAALETGNFALTMYFGAEMVLKLIALGPAIYAKDQMNLFDGFVVMFGFIEIIMSALGVTSANLNVLRCFRLLRVFKLARSWKELNRIMNTVLNSLNAIGYLSLLMGLFMFIMAVLGMQFFGYQLIFCDQYGLGPSVQPVCPLGLSVDAGTCPASHSMTATPRATRRKSARGSAGMLLRTMRRGGPPASARPTARACLPPST